MKAKNTLVLIGVVLFLGVAGFLFFNYRNSVVNAPGQAPTQTSGSQQALQVQDKKIADSTKPFSIDVVYPSIAGMPDFNKKVLAIITKELSDFKANSLANDKAVKDTDPQGYAKYPREYDLKITYVKGEVDDSVISIVFNEYNFEGAAHGNDYFISLNYNVATQKEMTLADVFSGQPNYITNISDFAQKDLKNQVAAKMGSLDGTWIADGAGPKAENFSTFLLNKNSITFYFPQYQVAPGTAGDFEVTMQK